MEVTSSPCYVRRGGIKSKLLKTLTISGAVALTAPHAFAENNQPVQEACVANSAWFQSPIAPPNEGTTSPFAFTNDDGELKDNSTDCDFHQWSWNKFLYLTQPDENGKLVMFGPDYYQVDNKLQPYLSPSSYLLPPPEKISFEKNLILEDSTQAGGATLYTKYKDNDNTPIHYSIHINNIFAESVAKSLATEKETQFDVGSVELKAAWVTVDDLKKIYSDEEIQNQYYIRNAIIMNDKKFQASTDVALVGLHVVGVVENHPEFIWATFEHKATAPDYYKSEGDFEKSTKYLDPNSFVSNKDDYMIYQAGTQVNQVAFDYKKVQDNHWTNIFRLYQYGVPNGFPYTDSSNTQYGASSAQQDRDAANFNSIASLNQSVSEGLAAKQSVWNNYFYAGSIWLSTLGYDFTKGIPSSIVGKEANPSLRGSLAAANMTMETYTQTFSDVTHPTTIKPENCFACHGISKGKSLMQVSHIFNNFIKNLHKEDTNN